MLLALVDLGIALGSASKTAQILNIDNRIMYSIRPQHLIWDLSMVMLL